LCHERSEKSYNARNGVAVAIVAVTVFLLLLRPSEAEVLWRKLRAGSDRSSVEESNSTTANERVQQETTTINDKTIISVLSPATAIYDSYNNHNNEHQEDDNSNTGDCSVAAAKVAPPPAISRTDVSVGHKPMM